MKDGVKLLNSTLHHFQYSLTYQHSLSLFRTGSRLYMSNLRLLRSSTDHYKTMTNHVLNRDDLSRLFLTLRFRYQRF
jgi:hypothetical protein